MPLPGKVPPWGIYPAPPPLVGALVAAHISERMACKALSRTSYNRSSGRDWLCKSTLIVRQTVWFALPIFLRMIRCRPASCHTTVVVNSLKRNSCARWLLAVHSLVCVLTFVFVIVILTWPLLVDVRWLRDGFWFCLCGSELVWGSSQIVAVAVDCLFPVVSSLWFCVWF